MGSSHSVKSAAFSNSSESISTVHLSKISPLAIYTQGGKRGSSHSMFAYNIKRPPYRELQAYEGHTREVNVCVATSDDVFLISGSQDNTCILWSVRTGTAIRTFGATGSQERESVGHTKMVTSLAILADNKTFVSGGAEGWAFLWKINKSAPVLCMKGVHVRNPKDGHLFESSKVKTKGVSCLVLVERDYVITGSDDGTAAVWDISTASGNDRDSDLDLDIWPDYKTSAKVSSKSVPQARFVTHINYTRKGHGQNVKITCMVLGTKGGSNSGADSYPLGRWGTTNGGGVLGAKTMSSSSSLPSHGSALSKYVLYTGGDDGSIAMWALCPNSREQEDLKDAWIPPAPLRVFNGHSNAITSLIYLHLPTPGQPAYSNSPGGDDETSDSQEKCQSKSSSSMIASTATDGRIYIFSAVVPPNTHHCPVSTAPTLSLSTRAMKADTDDDDGEEEDEKKDMDDKSVVKRDPSSSPYKRRALSPKHVKKTSRLFVTCLKFNESKGPSPSFFLAAFNDGRIGHCFWDGRAKWSSSSLSDNSVGMVLRPLRPPPSAPSSHRPRVGSMDAWSLPGVDTNIASELKFRTNGSSVDLVCSRASLLRLWHLKECAPTAHSLRELQCERPPKTLQGWRYTVNAWVMDRNEERMVCAIRQGKETAINMFRVDEETLGSLRNLGSFEHQEVDKATGNIGKRKPADRVNCMRVITVSGDRQLLVTGSYDKHIYLWDMESRTLESSIEAHKGPIYDMRVRQCRENGELATFIFTASRDSSIIKWKLVRRSGDKLAGQTNGGASSRMSTIRYTLRKECSLGVPQKRPAQLMTLKFGDDKLHKHPDRVWCCALHPRDSDDPVELLASGGHTSEIIVWDMARRANPDLNGQDRKKWVLGWPHNRSPAIGHTDVVHCLTFATVGEGHAILISGGADKAIRLWSMRDGRCIQVLVDDPNGRVIRSDLVRERVFGHFPFHSDRIRCLSVLRDEDNCDAKIVSGAEDKRIVVTDLRGVGSYMNSCHSVEDCFPPFSSMTLQDLLRNILEFCDSSYDGHQRISRAAFVRCICGVSNRSNGQDNSKVHTQRQEKQTRCALGIFDSFDLDRDNWIVFKDLCASIKSFCRKDRSPGAKENSVANVLRCARLTSCSAAFVVESIRDVHCDKISSVEVSKSGRYIYSVSSQVVRYDVRPLLSMNIVASTAFVQKRAGGDMVRKDSLLLDSENICCSKLVVRIVDNISMLEFVTSAVLLFITFGQLAYFAMHSENSTASELESIKALASWLEDFGLVGSGITGDLSYWITLGPCAFIIVLFFAVMLVQERVELLAFLTGRRVWKMLFAAISAFARIMSTVSVLPILKILFSVVNFNELVVHSSVVVNDDDVGSMPNFNDTSCTWEDSPEQPLSSTAYLVEDGANLTEFLSERHLLYVAVVCFCVSLYLPYVYRLQRVCGDLKRINATFNPLDMAGDDTSAESIRSNPLSLNGTYRYAMGLLVCKLALTFTVIFLGQARDSAWMTVVGQFVVLLFGGGFTALALLFPPYYEEMRGITDIFTGIVVSIFWSYLCSFVTVAVKPTCDVDVGVSNSGFRLLQFYIPLISTPFVFLGTLYWLDRVSERDGAWVTGCAALHRALRKMKRCSTGSQVESKIYPRRIEGF